jgi:hypothetical protein
MPQNAINLLPAQPWCRFRTYSVNKQTCMCLLQAVPIAARAKQEPLQPHFQSFHNCCCAMLCCEHADRLHIGHDPTVLLNSTAAAVAAANWRVPSMLPHPPALHTRHNRQYDRLPDPTVRTKKMQNASTGRMHTDGPGTSPSCRCCTKAVHTRIHKSLCGNQRIHTPFTRKKKGDKRQYR